MQTQRDHVHAYQFMVRRMTSALVTGDPSALEPPARRSLTGLVTGLVLGLLVVAGFGVFGIIVPGGNYVWQEKGAILVEEETGTRYVMLDGTLHPTLNQASAMLLAGKDAAVHTISSNSLAGLPHGSPVGIPDAPDPLPRPDALYSGPVMLCLSIPDSEDTASATLLPAGPGLTAPSTQDYLLVSGPDGVSYLAWRGAKHRLTDDAVAVALGLPAAVEAPRLWLDLLRDGPEIGPADIPGAGEPGMKVGGVRRDVGQLFEQPAGGGRQFFVLLRDGLARLSETDFTLLAARAGAGRPLPITPADVVATPESADTSLRDRLPDLTGVRPIRTADRSVCVSQTPTGTRVTAGIVLARRVPATAAPGEVGVALPPSSGLLVGAVPLPDRQRRPDRYLITDQGRVYAIPDDESMVALGLGGVQPVAMNRRLLSALPTGPTLSRQALGISN
jgi:type VII secretion protein EccB